MVKKLKFIQKKRQLSWRFPYQHSLFNQRLFSNDDNIQFSEYVTVNLEVNFVVTSSTQNAIWQANFAFAHFNASCSYCISDVTSTD
jgi:hypothetical protein